MSTHLNQALAQVAEMGKRLSKQNTGDDESNLCKAMKLADLIYHTKEMLSYAVGTIDCYEHELVNIIGDIEGLEEDGEVQALINDLEVVIADKEPSDWEEHNTMSKHGTGCK